MTKRASSFARFACDAPVRLGFGELHRQYATDDGVDILGAQTGVDMEWEEDVGVALEEMDELSVVRSVGASAPKPELLDGAERGDAHLRERARNAVHREDVERDCDVREGLVARMVGKVGDESALVAHEEQR